MQLVDDAIFVTLVGRLRCGIDSGVAIAVPIEPNQIGTFSETLDAITVACRRDQPQPAGERATG